MHNDTDLIINVISKIREKANSFIASELKNHNIEGIIPVHGDILYILFSYKELSMKDIAKLIDRKKSSVTTLVEKLIKLGYISKKTDPEDNRSSLVSLTKKGSELGVSLNQISINLIEKVYKDIPIDERFQLMKTLRKINDNF